ncbi:MAG: zinc-ribbon domain-containing protein [Candidatus Asgardarchaeia archaeon]
MRSVSIKGIVASYIAIFAYLYFVNSSYIDSLINNFVLGYYFKALALFFSVQFNYSTGYELQTFLLWSFAGLVIGLFSKLSKRAIVTGIIVIILSYMLWKIESLISFNVSGLFSQSDLIKLVLSLFICGFASIIGVSLSPGAKEEKSSVQVPPLVDLEPKEGPKATPETIIATKTCPHCGATISSTATYCPYCGKKV